MKNSDSIEKRSLRQQLSVFFKRLWKLSLRKEQDTSIREAIEELIEEDEESCERSIDSDEKLILGNVLNLKDLTAEDVMIPYANIVAIPITANQDEISSIFSRTEVSQVPVYVGTIDNIVGLLYLKDALSWINAKTKVPLKSVLKDTLYIAPTMRILDLLLQMRETGIRLAVVVDEYGGVDGIVTFSLLIENIIGDIQYADINNSHEQIEVQQNGNIVINASTDIEELDNSLTKLFGKTINWLQGLDDDDIDTIGGVVTFLAGRVPMKGEVITHPLGFEFEVIDSDPRRVKKIALRKISNLLQLAQKVI